MLNPTPRRCGFEDDIKQQGGIGHASALPCRGLHNLPQNTSMPAARLRSIGSPAGPHNAPPICRQDITHCKAREGF